MVSLALDSPATARTGEHALPASRRAGDLSVGVGGAVAGTAAIVLLHRLDGALLVACMALLGLLLVRWHERRDVVGLVLGLTAGNLTELLCDHAGVWVHASRSVLGIAPPYILACYPILLLTVPRLLDAVVGRQRPLEHADTRGAAWAATLWATHVALSYFFGTDNVAETLVCLPILAVVLWRFHDAHDVAHAVLGGVLGLVWEIPATWSGAWSFPHPQAFGLVPWWLPTAYAIFFVTLGRVQAFLAARALSRAGTGANVPAP